MPEPSSSYADDGVGDKPIVRKIRIHKVRPSAAAASDTLKHDKEDEERNAAMDRRIAELIPGIAELSVSSGAINMKGAVSIAADIRKKQLSREEAHRAEVVELASIFDMSQPNKADGEAPPEGVEAWSQELRPRVRRVQLSPYQYEMINYQRMLMRKNTWYYRDRMSVPRGPCPLHVLKDAWVQVSTCHFEGRVSRVSGRKSRGGRVRRSLPCTGMLKCDTGFEWGWGPCLRLITSRHSLEAHRSPFFACRAALTRTPWCGGRGCLTGCPPRTSSCCCP